MALVKSKPTSAGARFVVRVKTDGLYKGRPYSGLIENKVRNSGRNNQGRVTTRHKGGGHKKFYRLIDFRRDKIDVPGRVERIEYDPNRSAFIALVLYKDGERRYMIAPKGLTEGQEVISSEYAPIKSGNCLAIRNIPVGSVIHCVELRPGKGAQVARAGGASVQLIAKEGAYATIRLRSGEMRRVLGDCKGVIGEVSNHEHNLVSLGKAGASRWRGIRPTVRGVAMNPVDHPHGGGEGRTSGGRHPVSPWGTPTKGYKTRNNKRTDKLITRGRKQK